MTETGNQNSQYRATRTEAALLSAYGNGQSLEESVIDMLTDLRHVCDVAGLDFAKLDRIAYGHYLEEKK